MSGIFVNPDNQAFRTARRAKFFVDKTGLIAYANHVLSSKDGWICNTRPSGFGKTTAADMLAAYYSRGCDSSELFAELAVAQSADYREHLNQHNVIRFNAAQFFSQPTHLPDAVSAIQQAVTAELKEAFPEAANLMTDTLSGTLTSLHQACGAVFVILVDDWDFPIRCESVSDEVRSQYIELLSTLFKGIGPSQYLELAYLTGILPIIRLGSSALNNFNEFTMLGAGPLAPFAGFTEAEVQALCLRQGLSFADIQHRLGGLVLNETRLYSPRSVLKRLSSESSQSEASLTETPFALEPYLGMNLAGLKDSVAALLAGESIAVSVSQFQNDLQRFSSQDDVLTLLIHLGFLTYDAASQTAVIPNAEIREEFRQAAKRRFQPASFNEV